ncbi:hypothetical protein SeMB42_g01992 [Synchytrium endobioticum]|uniref:Uncharacterized protein n=1 Tax=Synchytrium endobioticum TaxID=286115 RepID=A0A507DK03_9FUNG|nr:hypothetical protein SeMB42_g01992 [Synchytrium endobioticum]
MPVVPAERINLYSKAAYVPNAELDDSDMDDADHMPVKSALAPHDTDHDHDPDNDYALVPESHDHLKPLDATVIPYKTSKKRKPTRHHP